ncbi:hypothetical protein ACDY96_17905 [Rhizobium mongolense]|uniref:hypothetical protein n=1 Tax=Rhizobium mongolense TaxID=57676 RepID=UPI00355827F0
MGKLKRRGLATIKPPEKQGIGIEPDIAVQITESDLRTGNDVMLAQAMRVANLSPQ